MQSIGIRLILDEESWLEAVPIFLVVVEIPAWAQKQRTERNLIVKDVLRSANLLKLGRKFPQFVFCYNAAVDRFQKPNITSWSFSWLVVWSFCTSTDL